MTAQKKKSKPSPFHPRYTYPPPHPLENIRTAGPQVTYLYSVLFCYYIDEMQQEQLLFISVYGKIGFITQLSLEQHNLNYGSTYTWIFQ